MPQHPSPVCCPHHIRLSCPLRLCSPCPVLSIPPVYLSTTLLIPLPAQRDLLLNLLHRTPLTIHTLSLPLTPSLRSHLFSPSIPHPFIHAFFSSHQYAYPLPPHLRINMPAHSPHLPPRHPLIHSHLVNPFPFAFSLSGVVPSGPSALSPSQSPFPSIIVSPCPSPLLLSSSPFLIYHHTYPSPPHHHRLIPSPTAYPPPLLSHPSQPSLNYDLEKSASSEAIPHQRHPPSRPPSHLPLSPLSCPHIRLPPYLAVPPVPSHLTPFPPPYALFRPVPLSPSSISSFFTPFSLFTACF